jgi:predicted DNA-binding transcriptional regulator AlpA
VSINQNLSPRFLRFRDLVALGVVRNWPTLLRWVEKEQFPAGRWLGPNSRMWTADEVAAWLAARPTARRKPKFARRRSHDQAPGIPALGPTCSISPSDQIHSADTHRQARRFSKTGARDEG